MPFPAKFHLACAGSLLLTVACQRAEDPITQERQQQAKQEELAAQASLLQTPREAATWRLVQDIRKIHFVMGADAGIDPLRGEKPFSGYGWSDETGKPLWEYPNLSAYKADIQRRTDSLRRTGPLDLRDTLFTPAQEAKVQENNRRLRAYYSTHSTTN